GNHRTKRAREIHSAQDDLRIPAPALGPDRLQRTRRRPSAAALAEAAGNRLRAAGGERLSAADGAGEPPARYLGLPARSGARGRHARARLYGLSAPQGKAEPARPRALGGRAES